MANWHIIDCEDCGAPRLTKYKNTKYCEICRLLRNLRFVGERTNKCPVDGSVFAPTNRNQLVSLHCDPYSPATQVKGTCGICHKEDSRLYGEHVSVCVDCMDDPKKRQTIYGQLLLKQKAIKEGRIVIERPTLPEKKKTAEELVKEAEEGKIELPKI